MEHLAVLTQALGQEVECLRVRTEPYSAPLKRNLSKLRTPDGESGRFVTNASSLSRGLLQIRHGLSLKWIAQMRSDTLVIDDGDAGVASEKQDRANSEQQCSDKSRMAKLVQVAADMPIQVDSRYTDLSEFLETR